MKDKKPTLYIVPGWGEKISQRNYKKLIATARAKYKVVPITYSYSKKVLLSKNIAKVKNYIKKPSKNDVIMGFSFGALIVYQIAGEMKFKQVFICSISPVVGGDLNLYPQKEVKKVFSEEQAKEQNKIKYKKPISPVTMFYGTKETKQLIFRSKALHKKYGGKLISIVSQHHELSSGYLDLIYKEMGLL